MQGFHGKTMILIRFHSAFFQFEAIKKYVENGGSVLVMLGEGGESKYNTNINFFLEEYGVMINNGELASY